MKLCACGCKKEVQGKSKHDGKPKRFIHGHNWRGKRRDSYMTPQKIECSCGCGTLIDSFRRKASGSPYHVKFAKGHMYKGKDNHFWKGGKTDAAKRFKQSGEYRQWRRDVFERDNYTCQECGVKNQKGLGRTVELHADHIKPFAFFPELRTELSNGRTLCADCHRQTNTFGPRVHKLYALTK